MFKIEKPGIYTNVPVADYHQDCCPEPSLTQSLAKLLLERSPAHAFAAHPKLRPAMPDDEEEPERYDKAKAIGDAAHRLLIGRGKDLVACDFPTWQTKISKEVRADALEAGKTPILQKHYERALKVVMAARERLDEAGLTRVFSPGEGEGEVAVAWQEDGLWFRTLIDWLDGMRDVTDLKTSAMSVAPHGIGRMGVDAGWDVQAAFHERALDHFDPDGRGRRTFRFVAIEQDEPFGLTVCELPESWLHMGRRKLAIARQIWRRCMESGVWPSYPTTPITPEFPGFREAQWMDREITEFEGVMRDVSGREMSLLEAG